MNSLRSLTIKQRIIGLEALLLLLILGVGGLAVQAVNDLGGRIQGFQSRVLPAMTAVREVIVPQLQLRQLWERGIRLAGDPQRAGDLVALRRTIAETDQILTRLVRDAVADLESNQILRASTEEDRRNYKQVRDDLLAMLSLKDAMNQAGEQQLEAIARMDPAAERKAQEALAAAQAGLTEIRINMAKAIDAVAEDFSARAVESQTANTRLILAMVAALVVLAALLGLIFVRTISRAFALLNRAVSEVASTRDFTRRTDYAARDEIGATVGSLNGLLTELQGAFGGIAQNTRQVAAAASQASTAVGQVSDGAQGQLNAINQISAAMEQTTQSISDVARNAGAAMDLARTSAAAVAAGRTKMDDMVAVVRGIADNSQKITQITEVISRIANQTNMLSLNAAIEAARAGEHGKGFAVVAEEVRKLAEHAADSVQEISQLIEMAVRQAERSVAIVAEVGSDMDEIGRAVRDSDAMMQAISAAITQQSSSIEEITASIRSLGKIGESNAAAAEEITATMVELSRLAQENRAKVEQFNC